MNVTENEDRTLQASAAPLVPSSTLRRRKADGVRRLAGEARISLWLPAEVMSLIEWGAKLHGSREAAVCVAVHHLALEAANGLAVVDDAHFVDGYAVGDGEHVALGLRLAPPEAAVLDRLAAEAGRTRSEIAGAALHYGLQQLDQGVVRLKPKA